MQRRETTKDKEVDEYMDLEGEFEDLLKERQSKTQGNFEDEVFDENEVMGRESRSS